MLIVFPRWTNEICSDDNEERAIVLAVVNTFQYVIQAWLPLLIWKVTDFPQYKRGLPTAIAFTFLGIVLIVLAKFLADRDVKRYGPQRHEDVL